MVLPLMDCGKLTTCLIDRHIHRMGPFSQKAIKYLLYCLCVGLKALHVMNILHRDIKSDNIFISSDGSVKLADLGLSVFLTQETTHRQTKCGTINWMAPELIDGKPYSKSVDCWAVGITAYEFAALMPPFMSGDQNTDRYDIMTKPVPPIEYKHDPLLWDFI